ncbi:MAG: hypothetical protein HQ567_25180 [Candidatus Nealsonbacteria bacterium]|nr:hypothetical protein [Candidatus Nealsonbacteria bacterium]
MLNSRQLAPVLAVFLALTATVAVADQEPPSADQIGQWIKQLDADEFSAREAAAVKLAEAGKSAIDGLAEAAVGESLEPATRSMQILRKLYGSDDEPTKTAAKEALKKIAKAGHSTSSPRAKQLISPKPKEQALPGVLGMPNIQIFGGGNVIAATTKSVSVSNVNGVKEIKVEEDGRKIKIKDDPKSGIEMSITETKDGKEKTKTVKAKNADELKKKDKAAYDLYKEYDQQNVGGAIQIQLQAGGIPGGIQIQPLLPQQIQGRLQLVPGGAQPAAAKQIEMATKQLERIGKQLQRASKDAEQSKELRKALKDLEAVLKKQLDDVQQQLKQQAKPETDNEPAPE